VATRQKQLNSKIRKVTLLSSIQGNLTKCGIKNLREQKRIL